MKKLLLLLISLSTILSGLCSQNEPSKDKNRPVKDTEEIHIDKLIGGGIDRPRSDIKFIEAYLNRTDSEIEVYFNYMFGEVTITIEDASGNTVTTQVCDTDAEEVIRFDAPATEGEYTIKIAGQDLSAEGTFAI